MSEKGLFSGKSGTKTEQGWDRIRPVNPDALVRPDQYRASDDLAVAVNVALTLGMPLLLTGEPGSGKSQLAHRVAWELDFPKLHPADDDPKPLKFVVKSTTEARDLFYTFDTVGRFHAAQTAAAQDEASAVAAVNFVEYQALGLAILYAKGKHGVDPKILSNRMRDKLPEEPRRTVVLLDEIDKAPRDVPNDLLTEIEEMRFVIPEIDGIEVKLGKDEQRFRPVVIITSNSERDLPDAFLRRCVFYHVPFPAFGGPENADGTDGRDERGEPAGVTVREIVTARLGARFKPHDKFLGDALQLFRHLRRAMESAGKLPSIAELLNWLDYLHHEHIRDRVAPPERLLEIGAQALELSVKHTLLKAKDDQARAGELMAGWDKQGTQG